MGKYIRTLTIQFDALLHPKEVTQFRGAVIASLKEKNILFHNHEESGSQRYSYPLIQYKRLHGKAAIVCVNDGINAIHSLFTGHDFHYRIGDREVTMLIEHVKSEECQIVFAEEQIEYRLYNWLPLNSQNYKEYQAIDGIIDRIHKLEEILTSNILSMMKGKGIDIYIDEHIDISIKDIIQQRLVIYKGVKRMAFDVVFKTKLQLPSNIGLGKSASVGFGVLLKNEEQN